MSIQIIEIRQFQGPATVELSGVGVPEIVEVRQGPAGVNGPNSVTSATTSDGTAELSLASLEAGSRLGLVIKNNNAETLFTIGKDNSEDGESGSITGLQIGFNTVASAEYSFAHGAGTTASGGYSHAEGSNTIASGAYSHASGAETTASGVASYATGEFSVASGNYSFAIGSNTTASGLISFAGGVTSTASGDYSYAYGTNAKAIHDGASVESDSQAADVESTTTDEKTFRFQNGYRFLGGAVTIDGTLNAAHIHGNIAGSVYAHVRAGEDLAKGDPVYVSGSHGTGENLIAIVSKADASNASKMPAVGVMDAAVSNTANGHMVITGTISDIDTNAYAVNSVLYVAAGGGWTSTPPAANSQPVAIVERSNTNNGAVIVKVNGLASSGGNGASDANKLVRYPSAGSTGSGAIVQATSPTLTSPTLTGTPNFTATNYTFASDARIGFLNNLSSQFVYKNGVIPFAEVFEDFPITGGTHGFITASGTTAYYAPASQAAARYWGAISMTTGATTDNTATITLAPSGGANGQTTSRFGLSHQICFCVNNATSSEFRARLQGSGITFDCAVLFATGVVQLESANIGGAGINTVSVATGLTLAAGDFISGTRYRLFVRCVSATQTEVYLASAPWNSETWTTLVDTIVTHSTPSITNVSTQPVYFVTTKTNAARIAYVDWVAIRYAIQR